MTPSRIWTLEALRNQRCVEVGNCWQWTGNFNSAGHSMMSFHGHPSLARRVAWCLAHGLDMDDIKGVRLWNTCANRLCINPKCTKAGDHRLMFVDMVKQGRTKASPAKRAACARAKRAASPRTMDDIRAIRAALNDGESAAQLAKLHRCSVSLVEKIGANQVWRELVPAASIFSMGGV